MGYAGARSWDALSQGLTGLGTAIAGKRRQTVEDDRLKMERAQADADRQAKWALELQSRGGGLGPRPTTTATIAGTGEQPDTKAPPTDIFAAPARPGTGMGVRPGGTGTVGVTAPKPPPRIDSPSITGPLTYEKPDDKYAAVGDIGYVKTPEQLAADEELRKADIGYGIGEAIAGAHPNDQTPTQRTQAGMAIANGAPWQAVTPDLTESWQTRTDKDGKPYQVNLKNGATRPIEGDYRERVPPTPGETTPQQERAARIAAAKALLDARNKIESMSNDGVPIELDERARRITEALRNSGFQSYNEAREIARTEQVGMPSLGGSGDPTVPPTRPPSPADKPGPGTPAPTPTGQQTSVPTTVLDEAKQQYEGEPDPGAAMAEDGWSEQDIEYMMGGVGGP